MTSRSQNPINSRSSLLEKIIWFCLNNKLVIGILLLMVIGWGVIVAPFDINLKSIERNPVPVDAIPDIGENQQIVFTEWVGRSPQDVEDQISYPLTVSLLGVPGVKSIRSYSMFGISTVYVIFDETVDFYFSRSRLLEKLSSLPAGTLPESVEPVLGPDATALGQIYWYTLEGRDPDGNPCGGWDLEQLRTIQDWNVKYALAAAEGVSEVASVGGFVREYQIDVDPDAMRAFGVSFKEIHNAVQASNIDVGARNIEFNNVEYFLRGVGFIKSLEDIENSVIKAVDNVPVLIKHVATVSLGPAIRRGALDKGGAEAVGGVIIARYGENPLAVIGNVKEKIEQISPSLPEKVHIDFSQVGVSEVRNYAEASGFDPFDGAILNQQSWLQHLRQLPRRQHPKWATISKVSIVPFYDRTGLIYETLGTLVSAISEQILIAIIVVILMVMHLRSSLLISGLLPLAVLMCFIAMKVAGVDANIVSLSGIAIAIGVIVDVGVVICENILRHLEDASEKENKLTVVFQATAEVGSAVLTAVLTTIVGFMPVFAMTGAEGKLFKPLAFTKIFVLIAAVIIAITAIPPFAHLLFCSKMPTLGRKLQYLLQFTIAAIGVVAGILINVWVGLILFILGSYYISGELIPKKLRRIITWSANIVAVLLVGILLASLWEPLGAEKGIIKNIIFVGLSVGILLSFFWLFRYFYGHILGWCLRNKALFLSIPLIIVIAGIYVWLGAARVFNPVVAVADKIGFHSEKFYQTTFWQNADKAFPGLGREFMPSLDEGSFLYMPTTMVHASIGETMDIVSKQDLMLQDIPEVESVVGKIGRAETPLDPAPISMIETVINYKSEYIIDSSGNRLKFKYDRVNQEFVRDNNGNLIPDSKGRPYRQWRQHIKSPDDIWEQIVIAADIEGTTSAPKLQPIAARVVMLQSGMRAPMGIKVQGNSLEDIEQAAMAIESHLKLVSSVEPATVIADRIIGKPYLEIEPDRENLAIYGITIRAFQDIIETAIGGTMATTTIEGRQRFPVRVRYKRELRDSIEELSNVLVTTSNGLEIPLKQLAEIRYVKGPQMIKSEDTLLTGYVLFDMKPDNSEVDVVEQCQEYLRKAIEDGTLSLPTGVTYSFAGNYQNQVRSQKTLAVVLPLSLLLIFLILYLQFRSVITTSLVFIGIIVAWSGGFLLIWLYGKPWFMNFEVFGIHLQTLFQIRPINLSVAVWVGFLALFGIASDDGVVMSTYLDSSFDKQQPDTVEQIRRATITAGSKRVRACLMTTATTILALLPVLTSTGRGSDVMVPMAIPVFGGMLIEVLTMLIVPVLYCHFKEIKIRYKKSN